MVRSSAIRHATHFGKRGNSKITAFAYDSLDPKKDQIRLLKLLHQPAASGELEYILETQDRNACPAYLALSYTWGKSSRSKNKVIKINGSCFTVRQNLYDFLATAARDENLNTSKFLWIDQICINQENNIEKSFQVKRMVETYSSAYKVLVWLGKPGNDASKKALPLIIKLSKLANHEISNHDRWQLLRAWRRIARIRYWSRLWVQQEFLLCDRVTVYHGEASLPVEMFGQCLRQYWNVLEMASAPCFYSRPTQMERLVCFRMQQTKDDFMTNFFGDLQPFLATGTWFSVLFMTRGTECDKNHDTVYALLGLVKKELRLQPNYGLPIESIFWDVVNTEKETMSSTRGGPGIRLPFLIRRRMGVTSEVSRRDILRWLDCEYMNRTGLSPRRSKSERLSWLLGMYCIQCLIWVPEFIVNTSERIKTNQLLGPTFEFGMMVKYKLEELRE